MSWLGIVGHDRQVERFRRQISRHHLATTFLFVGPEGTGKRTFAMQLAQSMLCGRSPEGELSPCGECSDCHQVRSDTHPDLQLIRKPADRSFIPVEMFIGDRDHRMRSGLCHFISLTPSGGKRRIAIIDDADFLNQEGANSLLKTLEEPSSGAVIILISTSAQRQLPTIRSRSQIVRFGALSVADVAQCLLQIGAAETDEQAAAMAQRSGGSVSQAISLADPSIGDFRQAFWVELARSPLDRKGLVAQVNEFLDSGGKDLPAKRAQLRLALQTAIEFYRALARSMAGASATDDRDLQSLVDDVRQRGQHSVETVVAQLERSVEGLQQVSMNANLGILVDAWVSDLATMTRGNLPLLGRTLG